MQNESFEDLVAGYVSSGEQHRLLYVFVRIGAMDDQTKAAMLGEEAADDEAGFVQVMFDAHQPAAHGLSFEKLRETADAHNADWNLLVVAVAKKADGSMPSEEDAQEYLANMRERVLAGDIGEFAVYDRDGQPVFIEAEPVSSPVN